MDSITTDFENWGPYLMKQFQQMYDKGERCDLEISCNKQIFLVHRLILSACSEYVRDLGDKQHIILPDEVSCKALKSIIDFVYTGKIIFCKDEKEDLLLASNLLNMRLLSELIKMEESCSFTLSMDEENEESRSSENTNNNLNLDLNESTDLIIDNKSSELSAAPQTVKKKEVRGGRPRGSKNTVLPPLFKFPYLHQKFSSSRTYGLITILTDLVPSRLDIPESVLQSCPFQSSFEDVTYETSILCSYESMNAPLEPVHLQFLKKIKESPQKRTFASALFSPFDKYTPPYNMNSEVHIPKKRESVTSYLSTIDTPAYKRPAPKTSQTPKKSVTFAKELEVIVECPRSYSEPSYSPKATQIERITSVETFKPLSEPPETTTTAIDVTLDTTPSDIDMELPAPLSPVTNISDDLIQASFVGSGEKVELTNLKNVAMPMEVEELDQPSVIEYQCDSSAPTVRTLATNGLNESIPVNKKLPTCEDITMIDANEVEMIQKDIAMATDETKSFPSKNSAAVEFSTIEQITKEVETEQQNLAVVASSERPLEITVAKTTQENTSAVADKSESEIEMLPVVTNESAVVSVTELSVVTSKAGATEQNSSTVDVAAKTTRKFSADIGLAETIRQNVPTVHSASEITQKYFTKDDGIKAPHEELSSDVDGTTLKKPPIVEPVPMQPVNSTETTQTKVLPITFVANTTSSSSSNISAPVISVTESEVSNVLPNLSSISNSSETTILPNIIEKPTDIDDSLFAPSTSSNYDNPAAQSKSVDSTKCPEDVILSDSTVFTAIDAKSMSQISTDPNSQIFALKVKGTENPTQLSQLVDLCKKNPLFKNKNVKFKIVPVKGSISKTLQEHAQLSSNMLNKAIIVQKTANMKSGNAQGEGANVGGTNTAAASPATKTGATKVISSAANKRPGRIPTVEKVTGPWECSRCQEANSSSPLKLNSYFEYRTHLHEVHNEPNNPIFCIHCGYKSLKRNQQLYHLLMKHQIDPPSNVQFPKCDKCDFYALNEYYLQKHQSTHQSTGMEYVCSCKAAFKNSEFLQQHMASNDCKNSSSFSCGYCNTQFSRFVNLKAHMRVCMKERAKPTLQNAPVIEPVKLMDEEPETILP